MANYKGHIAGAVVLAGIYAVALTAVPVDQLAKTADVLQGIQPLTAVFVVAILFGLVPDIDTNSKGQDIFFGLAFAADIILILSGDIQAAAYLGLIAMTPILGKHRGWTHSKVAMILIPLPILIIPYLYNPLIAPIASVYYGAAVVGYFSHLLLDGLIWKRFRIKN